MLAENCALPSLRISIESAYSSIQAKKHNEKRAKRINLIVII